MDRADYIGLVSFVCLFIIFLPIFIWTPLWWIWFFILIPPFGWGGYRYRYRRVVYVPVEDPRSPKSPRSPRSPIPSVNIELNEDLKLHF